MQLPSSDDKELLIVAASVNLHPASGWHQEVGRPLTDSSERESPPGKRVASKKLVGLLLIASSVNLHPASGWHQEVFVRCL